MDHKKIFKSKEYQQVPYSKRKCTFLLSCSTYYLLSLILLPSLPLNCIKCEKTIPPDTGPTTSVNDFYLEDLTEYIDSPEQDDGSRENILPTPRIDFPKPQYAAKTNPERYADHKVSIKPARVYRFSETETDLFSPVFNLKSVHPMPDYTASYLDGPNHSYQNDALPTDASSYSDLIDTGSGNYESPSTSEDSTNLIEESNVHNEFDRSSGSIAPTPVQAQNHLSFSPTPDMMINEHNQAPYLNRRLPRLAVTAGQVWKYFIPSDTFIDEDGDLRKLRSTIIRKNDGGPSSKLNSSNLTSSSIDFAQYYSWVQYDASSQLLYGLPTENDVGRHELALVVGDRFGATSQEMIEIHVRPHQSSRAFTHQFTINSIIWEPQKFPSMVDAIGELVKQISTRVFMDRAFENFIVHSYAIGDQVNSSTPGQDNGRMSFNLAWSNSSIPIRPCSIGQIESLFRSMVNTQFLRPDWSSDVSVSSRLPPSISMMRILEPDFKPESVSINLLGSCDSKELFKNSTLKEHDNSDSTPKVRVKIGVLSWKLGQPIEYRIPVETFGSDQGAYTTRDLQLSLHTIDGLTLDKDPKYDFMDFDQEKQIILGLPFNHEDHSGQRELQITARHPKSGYLVREVFIINIESLDLTTINNRAFQMSLYFHTRTRTFGPIERVSLSHKIVAATGGEDSSESSSDRRLQQITVVNIAKNINRVQLMSAVQGTFEKEYVDITRFERKTDMNSIDLREAAPVFKYSWTNESIGYLGDCPVEVIKENILYSLEQSMLDFRAPTIGKQLVEDQNKSDDSTRFFERLRQYFEPDLDLVHLRFEPIGACINAMRLHDVGDGDLADMIDKASELDVDLNQELHSPPVSQATLPKIANDDSGNEEYWSIVVLLILVVTLIFVIIMFFMGMHTYKINQDKRFEMQVKLAQARQNSMYLSSMILSNLASPNDCGSAAAPNGNRNMCIVQDEEKGSRKPVILDNEKHLFAGGLMNANGFRSMAVQLDGSSIRTTPLKPNSTVTLDSMASAGWQPSIMGLSMSPSALLYTSMEGKQRSMTLNKRSSAQRQMQLPQGILNHSQSILTVASLGTPMPVIPQGNIPLVYGPILPMVSGPNPTYNYASLQRVHQPNHQGSISPARMIGKNLLIDGGRQANHISPVQQQIFLAGMDSTNQEMINIKMNSPSRSSSVSASASASATTNSVISNPNYSPHR